MPRGPVAADPASQLKSVSEDYFSALGVPRRLVLNLTDLEKKYFELARLLHPDRFSIQGAGVLRLAQERMSFVNEAYRTLKDRETRISYLLSLEGVNPRGENPPLPLELAEDWFTLQETLGEQAKIESSLVVNFLQKLRHVFDEQEQELSRLEREYDSTSVRNILEKISTLLQSRNYLKSLKKDVERRCG